MQPTLSTPSHHSRHLSRRKGVDVGMRWRGEVVVTCDSEEVACGDDDGVDSRDDGVEMGRGGEVAVVERAAVVRW
ncbi:hypothetical protein Tco_1166401 [Tanacetum coccineum]